MSRAFRDEELTSSHWLIGPRSRGGPFRYLENRKPSSLIPRYCTDLALEASTLTIWLTGPWLNPFSSKSIDTHNPPPCSLNVLASPPFVKARPSPSSPRTFPRLLSLLESLPLPPYAPSVLPRSRSKTATRSSSTSASTVPSLPIWPSTRSSRHGSVAPPGTESPAAPSPRPSTVSPSPTSPPLLSDFTSRAQASPASLLVYPSLSRAASSSRWASPSSTTPSAASSTSCTTLARVSPRRLLSRPTSTSGLPVSSELLAWLLSCKTPKLKKTEGSRWHGSQWRIQWIREGVRQG